MVFGYATDETPESLPATLLLAHALNKAIASARRNGPMKWLAPNSRAQVVMQYSVDRNGGLRPVRIENIILSTQHIESMAIADIRTQLLENIVKQVVPGGFLDERTRYLIDSVPRGNKIIRGFDVGLTGRKIIVDTYGGWASHGGGAFSGKVIIPFTF